MSQHDIARQPDIDVTQPTISRILSDDRVRAILDRTFRRYVAASTGIGRQFIRLCFDEDKSIRLKAVVEWNRMMGYLPSHTQSVHIANTYNDHGVHVHSPEVVQILNQTLDRAGGGEISQKQLRFDQAGRGDEIDHV